MDYLLNLEVYLLLQLVSIVLNLIINGLPSKHKAKDLVKDKSVSVLNLIINGLPSKLKRRITMRKIISLAF